MLTPATLTSEKMGLGMKGIGCGVPLLIPVSAVPEAENQEDGPLSQQETEAQAQKSRSLWQQGR